MNYKVGQKVKYIGAVKYYRLQPCVIKSIEGTPGVNFMIQVSMLELYN
jgi:hypothetical protein